MMFTWAAYTGGFLGIGSLLAPLLVNVFVMETFTVTAIPFLFLFVSFFFIMKSPREIYEERKLKQIDNEDE